jgi:hypothetical protein
MEFYFPDSQDTVDPSFDFETEERSDARIRHRDDLYAHEIFSERCYDGLLVSKGIVDGFVNTTSRYTLAQRHRLLREGAKRFFRTANSRFGQIKLMGDCGAFTYFREFEPPYTVNDVVRFYEECGFDLGISIDHIVMAFDVQWDQPGMIAPAATEAFRRRELTLALARDFLLQTKHHASFHPIGVAHGWSPGSYAHSVKQLQAMGYDYIAIGGLVPKKTWEIQSILTAIADVRYPATKLHLLGVTRLDAYHDFARAGVASLDSTSPLRQAFKDARDNYYTASRTYVALRIPQLDANPKLKKGILSGRISQACARTLETECLRRMAEWDSERCSLDDVLVPLCEYGRLLDPSFKMESAYREVLQDAPWKDCSCDICKTLHHHVILFRGAERNRRRGLHNVSILYRRLQHSMAQFASS